MTAEKILLGAIINIKKGSYITKKEANEGPYPVILGGQEPAYYIDKYNHTGRAIVISRSGASAGYVSRWNEPIFVTDGFLIEPKEAVDFDYLYYLLKYHQPQLQGLQGGAAIPHVNPRIINAIEVIFPSIDEQTAIAGILSDYDNLIENNQKQIKLLEEAAQRLYKEWFVNLRFPGHENVKIVDGVPEGWEKKQICNIADIKAGGDKPETVNKDKSEKTPIPIYANGIEKDGLYGYTTKPVIEKESVTISARGTVGFVFLRRTPYVPIVRLLSVIPHTIPAIYIYYCLKNETFERNGTSQQQITVPMVKNKELLIADISVVDKFTSKVTEFHDEIDMLKMQIELLTEARDRLLPKLMSGEIEV